MSVVDNECSQKRALFEAGETKKLFSVLVQKIMISNKTQDFDSAAPFRSLTVIVLGNCETRLRLDKQSWILGGHLLSLPHWLSINCWSQDSFQLLAKKVDTAKLLASAKTGNLLTVKHKHVK